MLASCFEGGEISGRVNVGKISQNKASCFVGGESLVEEMWEEYRILSKFPNEAFSSSICITEEILKKLID